MSTRMYEHLEKAAARGARYVVWCKIHDTEDVTTATHKMASWHMKDLESRSKLCRVRHHTQIMKQCEWTVRPIAELTYPDQADVDEIDATKWM